MHEQAILGLAMACAPHVAPSLVTAIVAVESSGNPHAIGVIGGVLEHQPRSRGEALATALRLHARGWNYSIGLAQINVANLARMGLDVASALDPCRNLAAMQAMLIDCFDRSAGDGQQTLRRALSCYYSGNFTTGFHDGYVQRVVRASIARSSIRDPP